MKIARSGVYTGSTKMNAAVSSLLTTVQNEVGSMTPRQPLASPQQCSTWPTYAGSGMGAPVSAYPQLLEALGAPVRVPPIYHHQDWLITEERRAYMEATVEQDIAWQIASNRRIRKMSQSDLAQAIESKQSAIARLEDPTYGKHSIATLMKIAHAFDCALRVTLISYSRLAQEVEDTSDQSLYAAPFEDELHLIGR